VQKQTPIAGDAEAHRQDPALDRGYIVYATAFDAASVEPALSIERDEPAFGDGDGVEEWTWPGRS